MTPQPTERHKEVAKLISEEYPKLGCIEELEELLAEHFPDWMPIEELGDYKGGPCIEMTDGKSVDIAYWIESECRWVMRGSFVQLTHFREIGQLPQPQTSKEAE